MEDVERWLERIREMLWTGLMTGESREGLDYLVEITVREIAKEENADVLYIFWKIADYLNKNTKVCKKYIRNMYAWFMAMKIGKYEKASVINGLANNLRIWIINCYDMYLFSKTQDMNKLRMEIEKALEVAKDIIKKLCNPQVKVSYSVKWTWTSTSVTYAQRNLCKINIGLLGIIKEIIKHRMYEYPTVGKEIFKNFEYEKRTVYTKVKVGDEMVIPWIVVSHEAAHCVSNINKGKRRSLTGRRQVHDIYFLEAYKQILKEMAKYKPLIRRYVKV